MTTEYPLRWGILGAANIAVRKVVPAMRASPLSQVVAIASRSIEARAAATARDADQVPVSLETSVGNMDVIDALFRAAESRQWEGIRRATS